MGKVAVIDIGSTSIRASALTGSLEVVETLSLPFNLVRASSASATFDPNEVAATARLLLDRLAARHRLESLAITNQRASAVAFDPVAKVAGATGLSWEDLRTAPQCLALARSGLILAPSESATKFAWLKARGSGGRTVFGTLDAWLTCYLTEEHTVVTDTTNAAMTGLLRPEGGYDPVALKALGLEGGDLAPICPNLFPRGTVRMPRGEAPLLVTIADQQASLQGQLGPFKLTLGTSGVAEVELLDPVPRYPRRGPNGTFPVVTLAGASGPSFGLEAFWISAGSSLAWLEQLGVITTPEEASTLASGADRSKVPLVVPAFAGIGTPYWDFGARTVISGIAGGFSRHELAYGLLEGIAQAGALLIDALAADAGVTCDRFSLDGKAGHNPLVSRLLASLTGRQVLLSPTAEATTLGAGRIALSLPKEALPEASVIEPEEDLTERRRAWRESLASARNAIPALSAVRF